MVARRVQYVQLVNIPLDAVQFPVKVLDGRRVLLVEPPVQEAGHDGRLPNFGGSQNDHPVAVLGRDGEITLGRCHFLNHGSAVGDALQTQAGRGLEAVFRPLVWFLMCCNSFLPSEC